MAQTLKSRFGSTAVANIATMLSSAWSGFDAHAFRADCLAGFEALELMARANHMAEVMKRHLPADYSQAGKILLKSIGPNISGTSDQDAVPFLYLPHTLFVAKFGLEHFDLSMRLQSELTQRFSAEFSIRAFIEHDQARTLQQLARWSHDPNEHLRRLVSEGTRPRLPWANRLRAFQRDPGPVLDLLETLKDDPSLYVRRSVANNLNDIGKDHPDRLLEVAGRWLVDASAERRWIVEHALRSAVKRGDRGALALLGYAHQSRLVVDGISINPQAALVGDTLCIECRLHNPLRQPQAALIDLVVHYVKAHGGSSAKVFKLRRIKLGSGESVSLRKRVSLAQLTTRRHHAGEHRIDLLINGQSQPLGRFDLRLA